MIWGADQPRRLRVLSEGARGVDGRGPTERPRETLERPTAFLTAGLARSIFMPAELAKASTSLGVSSTHLPRAKPRGKATAP